MGSSLNPTLGALSSEIYLCKIIWAIFECTYRGGRNPKDVISWICLDAWVQAMNCNEDETMWYRNATSEWKCKHTLNFFGNEIFPYSSPKAYNGSVSGSL
jgi:hypothetical protein